MDPSSTVVPPTPEDKWALYAAALDGPGKDYYLKHFKSIDAGKGLGLSWNWAAMFFTFSWLHYRKMAAYSWAYFFVSTPALIIVLGLTLDYPGNCAAELPDVLSTLQEVFVVLIFFGYLLPPLFANRLYYRFVTYRIAVAQARDADKNELGQLLHKEIHVGTYRRSVAIMFGVAFLYQIMLGHSIPVDSSSKSFWLRLLEDFYYNVTIIHYDDYACRAKVRELLGPVAVYKRREEQFFAANKRLPAKIEEIGGFSEPAGKVKTVTLEMDGAIRVVAGAPLQCAALKEGRSILIIPSIRGDKFFWSCRSDDIPKRCMPVYCRE